MSGFEGTSSKNQGDDEKKNLQIIPYVSLKVFWNKLIKEQIQLARLSKILQLVVRQQQAVSNLKASFPEKATGTRFTRNEIIEAVPISYRLPDHCDVQSARLRLNMFIAKNTASQPKIKKRNTASLAGEVYFSFALPADFPPNGVEVIEKIPSIGRNKRRYTFLQRLKGWKVQRKQRFEGRYDMYYCHVESKMQLRSVKEVVDFFIYEKDPYKERLAKKRSSIAPVEGSAERKRTRSEPIKMKKPLVYPNSQSSGSKLKATSTTKTPTTYDTNVSRNDHAVVEREIEKKSVEALLSEAYNNLINRSSFAPRSSDNQDHNAVEETSQGINERNCRGENSRKEDDQEMVEAVGGDNVDAELGQLEREQKVKSEPIVNNLNLAKAEVTSQEINEMKGKGESSRKEDDQEMVEAVGGITVDAELGQLESEQKVNAEPVVNNLDSAKAEVTSQGINEMKVKAENSRKEDDQEMVEPVGRGDTVDAELGQLERGQKMEAEPVVNNLDSAKTELTSQGIDERKSSGENSRKEDDQEMVEVVDGDTVDAELGQLERGQLEAEPVVNNLDSAEAEVTTASSTPTGEQVAVANDQTMAQLANVILTEAGAESAEIAAQAQNTGVNRGGDDLLVLPSFSEQCDLINYIPILSDTDLSLNKPQ